MTTLRSSLAAVLAVLAGAGLAGVAFAATPAMQLTAVDSILTVAKAGSGSGAVISNVGAIDCAPTCNATYANGTPIALTATPAGGSQFTGWLGPCTGTGTCQFTINGATTVSATFATTLIGSPTLDIDGTASHDALTDGLLIIRYLFGLSGPSLINGAVGLGATRATATPIGNYLTDIRPVLDIDGNGQADALTDGLMVIRYLFGLRGAALIAGAVGSGAIRAVAGDIEARIAQITGDGGAPAVARVEAGPAGVLLTQIGASRQLSVVVFDAQNNPLNVPIVWTSSDPAIVSVDPAGVVHAAVTSGTALITASAGSVQSEPVYAYVAAPVAGALLLTDSQIVSGPVAVDPGAEPSPGNAYEVVLRGVPGMPPGTIVINTEALVVGGQVVDVQPQGSDLLVRLVVVPPQQLFTDFAFKRTIDLSKVPFETPADIAALYDVGQTGNTFVFTPKPPSAAVVLRGEKALAAVGTHALPPLPPFSDCEASSEFGSGLPVPLSLTALPTFTIQINGTLVNEFTPQGRKIAVIATPVLTVTTVLEITSAFEAKIECKATLHRRRVRVPGWAGLFFGGDIEFGVGFEVAGKVTLVSAKVGGSASLSATIETGILCPTGTGNCALSGSATATSQLTPTFEAPSLDQTRFEPSVNLFAFVSGELGNADLQQLQFKAIEAKVGAKLDFSYTLEALQIDNVDIVEGRSKYALAVEGEIGPGLKLGDFLEYIGFDSFVPLKLAFSLPLGESPTGTVTADSVSYLAGEPVSVTVQLNPASTLFFAGTFYNVDRVVVLRKSGLLSTEALATQIATDGQTSFTLAFNSPGFVSASELFAFVVPRFLALDPPKLEIGSALGSLRMTALLPAQIFASAELGVTVDTPIGNGQYQPVPNMLVELSPSCASVNPVSGRTDVNGQFFSAVTRDASCASLSIGVKARANANTPILALQTVTADGIVPRMTTLLPGQIFLPANLRVSVETPLDETRFEPTSNVFVQLAPTCATVNPASGLTDAGGHFNATVTAIAGCAGLAIAVTANTAPVLHATVNAGVSPIPIPVLGGYDGTARIEILGCPDCGSERRPERWLLEGTTATTFTLKRLIPPQGACLIVGTETCTPAFEITNGSFQMTSTSGNTISGTVGNGALHFVYDRVCLAGGQPDTCRTTLDGARPMQVTPASLDFGTVAVGGTSTRSVTIRNTGPLPVRFVLESGPSGSAFAVPANNCLVPLANLPLSSWPSLASGSACIFPVKFTPSGGGGNFTGTVAIVTEVNGSNDGSDGKDKVLLIGVGN